MCGSKVKWGHPSSLVMLHIKAIRALLGPPQPTLIYEAQQPVMLALFYNGFRCHSQRNLRSPSSGLYLDSKTNRSREDEEEGIDDGKEAGCAKPEHELELIKAHMAQKPVLRVEVSARALREGVLVLVSVAHGLPC